MPMFFKYHEKSWKERLEDEVKKLRSARTYQELTLNRLKEVVDAPNEKELVRALTVKVLDGELKVIYRVLSPKTNAELASFDSPADVPRTILDESTGEDVEVNPFRDVEAVYVTEAARA